MIEITITGADGANIDHLRTALSNHLRSENIVKGVRIGIFKTNIPPIKEEGYKDDVYADIPTAEQMIGWLEEQDSDMRFEVATGIAHTWHYYIHLNYNEHYRNLFNSGFSSRKEATIAAIDAALEYLTATDL